MWVTSQDYIKDLEPHDAQTTTNDINDKTVGEGRPTHTHRPWKNELS